MEISVAVPTPKKSHNGTNGHVNKHVEIPETDERFVVDIQPQHRFRLDSNFINSYAEVKPDWGPLGEITYRRTYSRRKDNGTYEEWFETVARVVQGSFTYQKWHCRRLGLPWYEDKAQRSAQTMYDLIFNFKFLPPGRGLWMCGTEYVEKYGGAALNNCSSLSTEYLHLDFAQPFVTAMDFSMLGIGVGSDTRGAGKVTITKPVNIHDLHVIDDSREGWLKIVERVLNAYVGKDTIPGCIDYNKIRPAGAPIKGFGGVSAGHAPLRRLIDGIHQVLTPLIGLTITAEAIVDLLDIIGVCVVSGNVRRSALLILGENTDKEFMRLKDPELHGEALLSHRWASNNSILADVGMDYSYVAERTARNGEPGYLWLNNCRAYGRMIDLPDWKDRDVTGTNPCQPAWATVLTPTGINTIGNLNIGDTIWSGKQWTKVIKKWSTGIKPVYAVKTRAGIFYGTENHRIVSNGEKIEAGQADSIDTCVGGAEGVDALSPQDVMDGLVIGDGTVHKASNNLVVLLVGAKDQDYFTSEVKDLLTKDRSALSPFAWEINTTISKSELPSTFLREIPERFRFGNETTVRGFLRGLYTANGSIVKKDTTACGRVTLKASSITVINHVQEMLSSLGIRSYYTTNKEHNVQFNNGEYTCKESYDLNVTTDRDRFQRLIGFIQKDKTLRLNAICDYTPSKYACSRPKTNFDIVERELLGDEEVFDLTVEAEEHTYWTGGVLVSNCSEQSLVSGELCCLCETFPSRHDSYEEYQRTLKYAYLYAKSITLIPTHNKKSNAIVMRNRRIGMSQSGIVESFAKHGRREHLRWCDQGYAYIRDLDLRFSDWLCVPRSRKVTSVKPSGTVSLLPGVTPGIHYPHAKYYYRTIRLAKNSQLLPALIAASYRIEDDVYDSAKNTAVVYFPVEQKNFDRSKNDVSMWEQLENAAAMQAYWADNQVSVTITFKPEEAKDIEKALELYESRLKSVSFLPIKDHSYKQAPYQAITEAEYLAASAQLKPINFNLAQHEVTDKFCDGESCAI